MEQPSYIQTSQKRFEIIYTLLFLILVIGTPLLFSSITRSVFEVHKLLLLRYVTLALLGTSIFQAFLMRDTRPSTPSSSEKHWTFFGFQWKKIGIEWPVIIYIILNILSTTFSQNIVISIIGAYDRWEGILTISNYMILLFLLAKLITTKKQFIIILMGLLGATFLSSLYGVWQSLGFDFMNWSVDPTKRVFACINNPVHYCAYVAMCIPIAISLGLYFTREQINISNTTYSWITWPIIAVFYSTYYWIANILSTPLYMTCLLGALISVLIGGKKILSIKASLTKSEIIKIGLKSAIFICINIIYFTQYLSYSRATWMGFIAAMSLFFIFILNIWNKKNPKYYFIEIFASLLIISNLCLTIIFKLHTVSTQLSGILFGSIAIGIFLLFYIEFLQTAATEEKKPQLNLTFINKKLTLCILLYMSALLTRETLHKIVSLFSKIEINSPLITILFGMILLSTLVSLWIMIQSSNTSTRNTLIKLIVFILFAKLQFISESYFNTLQFFVMITLLFLCFKQKNTPLKGVQYWSLNYILIFGLILIIPVIPAKIKTTLNLSSNHDILAQELAQSRIESYKNVAIKGSARSSMWRSSIPWIKDHWSLGSGLDTIKFMYPVYRESIYGILEGGHNFTPDRLHNEYLNSLATRGIPSTLIYYLLIIGLPFFFCIRTYFYTQSHLKWPYIGLTTGAMIYLGQVMFNFGVVATIVLFLLCIGMGLSLKTIIEKEDQSHE